VLIARPMLSVIARYASRYSVRALDLTVDSTLLWVGVSLALIASVLLAFIPGCHRPTRPRVSGSPAAASALPRARIAASASSP
jgi:hypothetical protein